MKNLFFLFLFSLVAMSVRAQSFTGEKTDWHGFDRYDFVMSETTFQIKPIKATQREGAGVAGPEKGKFWLFVPIIPDFHKKV